MQVACLLSTHSGTVKSVFTRLSLLPFQPQECRVINTLSWNSFFHFGFFRSHPLSLSPDIFSVEHGELPDSSFVLWKTGRETRRGGIVYEPSWKCTHCVLLCATPDSSTNELWGRSLLPGVCERRPGLPQVGGCLGFALLLTQL